MNWPILNIRLLLCVLVCALVAAGCGARPVGPATATVASSPAVPTPVPATATSVPTETPIPPTPTPPPTATPVPPTATPVPTATSVPPTVTPTPNFRVSSIPAGSKVYIASLDDLGLDVSDQEDWDYTTRRLLGTHRLDSWDRMKMFGASTNKKHLRGVAPLQLYLPPGNYAVVLHVPDARELAKVDPFTYRSSGDFGPTIIGKCLEVACRVYLIEIPSDDDTTLIHVWQPVVWALKQMEDLYPKEDAFKTDDEAIEVSLGNNIPKADIPLVLRLLRRGGKVTYPSSKTRTITIEVDSKTGGLSTLIGWEEGD